LQKLQNDTRLFDSA